MFFKHKLAAIKRYLNLVFVNSKKKKQIKTKEEKSTKKINKKEENIFTHKADKSLKKVSH